MLASQVGERLLQPPQHGAKVGSLLLESFPRKNKGGSSTTSSKGCSRFPAVNDVMQVLKVQYGLRDDLKRCDWKVAETAVKQ